MIGIFGGGSSRRPRSIKDSRARIRTSEWLRVYCIFNKVPVVSSIRIISDPAKQMALYHGNQNSYMKFQFLPQKKTKHISIT
jgi:hypothetical protein